MVVVGRSSGDSLQESRANTIGADSGQSSTNLWYGGDGDGDGGLGRSKILEENRANTIGVGSGQSRKHMSGDRGGDGDSGLGRSSDCRSILSDIIFVAKCAFRKPQGL